MKIGLLAMSGIRVRDARMLELGLTLPGFVERSKIIASLPSLGLLCLAATTPPKHDMHYFEAEADGAEPPELYEFDLVAISTFSAQVFEAYAIADRLRRAGVKVAMGGLHVSVCPDEAMQHADYVVVGEGDNVWPAVIDAASRAESPHVFRAADHGPVVVERLPSPRFDLLQRRAYNRFTVQTSRGCPWRCEFCASTVMLQERYRKRSIDQVVGDIETIQRIHSHPFIEFADDNTFVDANWGKELCWALTDLHVRWFTETDITVADDPELLNLMRKAGCRQVLIGLESPNRPVLEGLELRANRKAVWSERTAEAVQMIQSHGITVNGCFILGLDGHTPDIFQQVYEFAMDLSLYDVQITILTPFPGTPLYARLLREGRIIEPGRWDLCTLFDVNYRPQGMTENDLRKGMYWLGQRLYNDEATRQRRERFFDHLKHYWS